MTKQETIQPFEGYLLLPRAVATGYRGVDRNPFTPSLIMEETDPAFAPQREDLCVWIWYPRGWKREAYRVYEENTIEGTESNLLYLLSSVAAARQVQKIIEPHVGFHEILGCRILNVGRYQAETEAIALPSLGYDVAYLGGDFYSAVKNGLLVSPGPELLHEYAQLLNEFELFADTRAIPQFVRRFKQLVTSEATSSFYVYALRLVEDG